VSKNNKLYAVLTGDIVESQLLSSVELKIVLDRLREGAEQFEAVYPGSIYGRFDRFHGDSWQLVMPKRELSIRAAMYFLAKLAFEQDFKAETRIAVAWGPVDLEAVDPNRVSESSGETFNLSVRTVNEMHHRDRICLALEPVDGGWGDLKSAELLKAAVALADEVASRWSRKQAQAVGPALLGHDSEQIVEITGRSSSSISVVLNYSGWRRIIAFLNLIEEQAV